MSVQGERAEAAALDLLKLSMRKLIEPAQVLSVQESSQRLPSQRTLEEHGALDALLELREAGKVRFVGMSGTLPHLTDHVAMGVFGVFQNPVLGGRA